METSDRFHSPALYARGNSPRNPFNKSDWVQSRCRRFGEETNILPLTGVDTGRAAQCLAAVASRTSCADSGNCEKYGFEVRGWSLVGRTVPP